MRRTSTSAIGAFHPVLFFILVYVISILMALFVCRSVYISVYGDPDVTHLQTKAEGSLSFAATSTGQQTAALR